MLSVQANTLFALSLALATLGCAQDHANSAIADPKLGVVGVSSARPGSDSGSGFLISANGLLITTGHLSGGSSVNVTLADGRTRVATFLEEDRDADVALLKIPGEGYPFLRLSAGDIEPVMRIRLAGRAGLSYGVFDRWESSGQVIGFTAHVTPADCGAPLLADDGAVIGIVREPSPASTSPQLATPIWRVVRMLPLEVK